MYEKDGEKYFIFDSHLHFWDASPANWVKGQEEYAKGWIECFHAYQGLGPPETHWSIEHFQKYSVEDFEKDVFDDGGVDMAVFQSTYLKEWYTDGLQRHRPQRGAARPLPWQADRQRPLGPARGRGRPRAARGRPREVRPQGRQALHGRVVQGLARLEADRPRGRSRSSTSAPSSGSRTSTSTRARRSGRWTRTPSTSPTSTTWRRTTTDAQLHRRARRPAADRGLLLHGDAGAQRLRRPRRRHRRPDARPPAVLREGHGRAAVLGRRGQDDVRLRLRDLGAEVADRGLPRTGTCPTRPSSRTTRGWTPNGKRKILGLNAAKLYGVEVPAGVPAARDGGHAGRARRRAAVEGAA